MEKGEEKKGVRTKKKSEKGINNRKIESQKLKRRSRPDQLTMTDNSSDQRLFFLW